MKHYTIKVQPLGGVVAEHAVDASSITMNGGVLYFWNDEGECVFSVVAGDVASVDDGVEVEEHESETIVEDEDEDGAPLPGGDPE